MLRGHPPPANPAARRMNIDDENWGKLGSYVRICASTCTHARALAHSHVCTRGRHTRALCQAARGARGTTLRLWVGRNRMETLWIPRSYANVRRFCQSYFTRSRGAARARGPPALNPAGPAEASDRVLGSKVYTGRWNMNSIVSCSHQWPIIWFISSNWDHVNLRSTMCNLME